MKVSVNLALVLCATLVATMLSGCNLPKSVTEALQKGKSELEISIESRESAFKMIKRLHQRRYKAIENALKKYDVSTLDKDLDRILMTQTGLDASEVDVLLKIHFDQNPQDAAKLKVATSDLNLIAKYIGLRFEHPEKQPEELLALFRQTVQFGKTTVSPERIAERYDFYILSGPPGRARKIATRYDYRAQELFEAAKRKNDFSNLSAEQRQARLEITGIDDELLKSLSDIYGGSESSATGLSDVNIIYSYLRLVFENPEQSQDEHLELFRELVNNGN